MPATIPVDLKLVTSKSYQRHRNGAFTMARNSGINAMETGKLVVLGSINADHILILNSSPTRAKR